MKTIIAGGRDFDDVDLLYFSLLNLPWDISEVVSGGARGADTLGEVWASSKDIHYNRFPANWDKYGKQAGFLRNVSMGEYADALVAFWDGKSKGTKHMIDEAVKRGLYIKVFLI